MCLSGVCDRGVTSVSVRSVEECVISITVRTREGGVTSVSVEW